MRPSLAVLALAAVASTSTLFSKRQFPGTSPSLAIQSSSPLPARVDNDGTDHPPTTDCAEDCLVNADFGGCAQTDDVCLCNSPAFIDSLNACIDAACTGGDLTIAEQEVEGLCAAVATPPSPHLVPICLASASLISSVAFSTISMIAIFSNLR
ncbi:hypothetical protein CERSUDRAFT_95223 [Gelatoporia subvermispora B]|uniref:CFEM domain-containing protein n=1 Tax=Ceriporiopsis subvermispora (strain B) TaxID=914234 RepID=M2QXU9_CERS8|nr:hypothetical protein CERSUDRAFT_95223 [Gelatoporia subvermispora B]